MRVERIRVCSWTASFRYPRFMIGIQPTLNLPPLSTLYGLLSAVAGQQVTPHEISIAYTFEKSARFVDLESIFEVEDLTKTKSNIIRRENLYDCELFLYLKPTSNEVKLDFKKPRFPLLLGRSCDLASIIEFKTITLEKRKNCRFGRTIVPRSCQLFPRLSGGVLQALPAYMTSDIPREPRGVQPFVLLEEWQECPEELWYDAEKDQGLWFHTADNLGLVDA